MSELILGQKFHAERERAKASLKEILGGHLEELISENRLDYWRGVITLGLASGMTIGDFSTRVSGGDAEIMAWQAGHSFPATAIRTRVLKYLCERHGVPWNR